MGIFSRLSDIINSNLNAILDRAEDPEKMIRLIIQEMEETLVEVRSSSARVIADKKDAQRRLDRLQSEADDWEGKARLALEKGREDLARAALSEKQGLLDEIKVVEQEFNALDDHLAHLSEEIAQLQTKLNDAKAKQKTMMMRQKTVSTRMKTRSQLNKDALNDAFEKFEHYERRMDNMESQLEAEDLGRDVKQSLKNEIDSLAQDDSINAELERLKADLSPKKDD
ncbi:phage shock protein PspA [Reinekea blandensis]|uniref:Phage shock protein A (IM30), suppresses sigma54-dependent transcription n=1 Tax=Reinekea blandensis MED297 TaxID=314283 RepID=A4BJ90_9GAMM|nr:phage shock protein PspA [Reinekea blandensis]EAR07843.1 Phage shock protein A (IM30), suppresses sigma54-dependent transcription [Reinekea sp. MED297] [Reinekea blandensis MED297]